MRSLSEEEAEASEGGSGKAAGRGEAAGTVLRVVASGLACTSAGASLGGG